MEGRAGNVENRSQESEVRRRKTKARIQGSGVSRRRPFDKPFDKLTVLSNVEGLRAMAGQGR